MNAIHPQRQTQSFSEGRILAVLTWSTWSLQGVAALRRRVMDKYRASQLEMSELRHNISDTGFRFLAAALSACQAGPANRWYV